MSKKSLLSSIKNVDASAAKSILPKQTQEFTSKQYWNQFFEKLNQQSFEWYGKTEDIYPILVQHLNKESKILMIGCGNSNLSSDLYDAGYEAITNVDYSEIVIQEMIGKNHLSRPNMKWDIGDVTDLHGLYRDEQFDVIIDKGTLDAIFSNNTPELIQKTTQMFQEIERILISHDGLYICISLAQDYILNFLIDYFRSDNNVVNRHPHPHPHNPHDNDNKDDNDGNDGANNHQRSIANRTSNPPLAENYYYHPNRNWNIEICYLNKMQHPNTKSTNEIQSPLQPFIFKISKKSSLSVFNKILRPNSSQFTGGVMVFMDPMGNAYDSSEGKLVPFSQISSYIQHIQDFYMLRHSIQNFEIGKFETLHFWTAKKEESSAFFQSSETGSTGSTHNIPRYSIYILDANESGKLSIAVFIIPSGREADYQFISKDGLLDIAFQANCKRLIAVSCNRPYPYPEMKALQDELSPIILSLKFSTMKPDEVIPYMAVNQDHSWEVIAQGESKLSGIYIVEEKSDEVDEGEGEDGEDPSEGNKRRGLYRRLIFLQNQQFIQTEVHLVPSVSSSPAVTGKSSSGNKKKKSSKKKKNQKSKVSASSSDALSSTASLKETEAAVSSSCYVYDYDYLDEHHKGFLLSFCLSHSLTRSASLPFSAASQSDEKGNHGKCLLIGLGGGSLPMILQKYYPSLALTIIEIDEVVYEVAKQYFGYTTNPALHEVIIDEGVHFISRKFQEILSQTVISSIDDKFTKLLVSEEAKEQSQLVAEPASTSFGSLPLCYDVIVIDVDCKDPSVGLSAPPKEFISNDTLQKLYALLSPKNGMLLINTVARNKSLLDQFIDRLKIIFRASLDEETSLSSLVKASVDEDSLEGRILQLQATSENVNLCIICLKNGAHPFQFLQSLAISGNNGNTSVKKKKGMKSATVASDRSFNKTQLQIKLQIAVEHSLDLLLSNANDVTDSLQLKNLVEKFQII